MSETGPHMTYPLEQSVLSFRLTFPLHGDGAMWEFTAESLWAYLKLLFVLCVFSLQNLSPYCLPKILFFFNFQFLGTVSHVGSHKIGWNLVSVAFNYVLLLPAMLFNAKVLPSQLLLCQWYLEQGMRLAGTPHSWLKEWTLYFLAFLKLISWCSEISQYFERVSWKFCHMVSSLLSFVFILFKERNNLFSLVWIGKHKG